MPRLVHISGNFFFMLWITENKAIIGTVFTQPLIFRGLCLPAVKLLMIRSSDIHAQSGFVFAIIGRCNTSQSIFFSGTITHSGTLIFADFLGKEYCLFLTGTITAYYSDRIIRISRFTVKPHITKMRIHHLGNLNAIF